MTAYLLHEGTSILCPHGGTGVVAPAAVPVRVGGRPVLLADATVTIAGCAFTVAGAPQPCVRVRWQAPAARVTVNGIAVLLSTSVGLCVNGPGAPQGTAQLSGYQTRVSGQ
ncbi:hypothetical protein Drose_13555 [Dactylosporangium roseum]|uniref:Uncharacterized protein n=1 Tax=Dactylosporangium roseum TaxID=47989 RepID=A0ABY5ZCL4_9ACTN|nr:hypothetical protein [Dactylosporangium roseum]UWZ39157.1 hypothetical protein Drose_13555 [Dactylosporangium roseum]